MGFFEETSELGVRRGETFTCAHCNSVFECIDSRSGQTYPLIMCHNEMKRVCKKCHKIGTCTPFEKVCDEIERNAGMTKGAFRRMG